MTFRFSLDDTEGLTPVPSLSVGPTRQVNRQHDVMQQRRRLRAGHPKEILWVVLCVFIECGGERISLLGISRANNIFNRCEQIVHARVIRLGHFFFTFVRFVMLPIPMPLVTGRLVLPAYLYSMWRTAGKSIEENLR